MMKKTISLLLAAILSLGLLAACGGTAPAAPTATAAPAPTETPAETTAPTETPAHPQTETNSGTQVAGKEDMTAVEEVVDDWMIPIGANYLNDGVWPVTMRSSSSMFKADHCELVVENGAMQVVLYMSSESYPWMYAGTAEEAASAPESEHIPLTDGTFTLPLEALDSGESFAAFSKRKELWYDRTLLFLADSLPVEAFSPDFFVTAESLGLENGSYLADISLSGGSGRASVSNPATVYIENGEAFVMIQWSSKNYDYMRISGEKLLPVNEEGDYSTFRVPVPCFDRPFSAYADTTAMSEPHEILYRFCIDSSTLEGVG